jgi:hypothetical protein
MNLPAASSNWRQNTKNVNKDSSIDEYRERSRCLAEPIGITLSTSDLVCRETTIGVKSAPNMPTIPALHEMAKATALVAIAPHATKL